MPSVYKSIDASRHLKVLENSVHLSALSIFLKYYFHYKFV